MPFDARIQGIVDNWPQAGGRPHAPRRSGMPRPPELKVIVEQYLEDFGSSAVR
jgi:D-erythronate 2-dehydrogenase